MKKPCIFQRQERRFPAPRSQSRCLPRFDETVTRQSAMTPLVAPSTTTARSSNLGSGARSPTTNDSFAAISKSMADLTSLRKWSHRHWRALPPRREKSSRRAWRLGDVITPDEKRVGQGSSLPPTQSHTAPRRARSAQLCSGHLFHSRRENTHATVDLELDRCP